jgi:2-polyprenyl-3-methyl-5-hydroxy-6-metoxy-1,4-benzoquinol methylase
MPTPADSAVVRRLYDDWHARAESADSRANAPWHRLLFRHLDPARDIGGRSVLEIGCGRGELALHFGQGAYAPARYVGADFAPAAIELARRRGTTARHQLRWTVADIESLGLQSGSFDTVISCETIEHLPHPAAAVRELRRVLRPGGRLFLTTPNYLGVVGAYRIYLRATGRRYTEGGQPVCRVTMLPRTAAWILRAGFRIRTCDAAGHYSLWPGRIPVEVRCPAWLSSVAWPFALHSIIVAENPGVHRD